MTKEEYDEKLLKDFEEYVMSMDREKCEEFILVFSHLTTLIPCVFCTLHLMDISRTVTKEQASWDPEVAKLVAENKWEEIYQAIKKRGYF